MEKYRVLKPGPQNEITVRNAGIPSETALLGTVLAIPKSAPVILEDLDEDDFVSMENRFMFLAMRKIYKRGDTVDTTSLQSELAMSGHPEIGGMNILRCIDTSLTFDAVETHIGIIKQCSVRRNLIEVSRAVFGLATSGDVDATEALGQSEQLVTGISLNTGHTAYVKVSEAVDEAWDDIQAIYNAPEGVVGMKTGFRDLDNVINGIKKDDYIIIGARPAMGKTALAGGIAVALAKQGYRVGFLSLEMSKSKILQRMIMGEAKIGYKAFQEPENKEAAMRAFQVAKDKIAKLPIFINDAYTMTVSEMRSVVRRMVLTEHVDCVFVDYAQRLRGQKNSGDVNRRVEMSDISRAFLELKKELGIAIVALAQLNRNVEGRQVKRPQMSDLSETGSFEQDADVIILLHRADYYKKPGEDFDNTCELIVAKNRGGNTTDVNVWFIPEQTRFIGRERLGDLKESLDGSAF